MNWQPIETAPKDGTNILAFQELQGCAVIYWIPHTGMRDGGWWMANGVSGYEWDTDVDRPTHWQPLPETPQ